MVWYDFFAHIYDPALEDLYAPFRPAAIEALQLRPGDRVLDAPCGTGQSLPGLVDAVGEVGGVVGFDASPGMLAKARKRILKAGWSHVELEVARIPEGLPTAESFDGILCSLGLTALPASAFEALWGLLRPGGRLVLFDVYADKPGLQTWMVERMAQAKLDLKVWLALEEHAEDFQRQVLPADPARLGGELFVASGTKPAAPQDI